MNDREEDKLPLHDEAEAREKWRGGETILDRGGKAGGLPASEVDDAAVPDQDGEEHQGGARHVARAGLSPPD